MKTISSNLYSESAWLSVWEAVQAGAWREIVFCASLTLIAVVLSLLLNRLIDKMPHRSWRAKAVDFLAPLLASLLTAIFIGTTSAALHYSGFQPVIFPLALKLAFAWFAIHLVMLMSSRKTAGWFIALVIIPITLLQLFGLWKPITKELKSWKLNVGDVDISAYAALKTVAMVVILFWIAGIVVELVESRLKRMRSIRASNRVLIMKIFQIVLYFIVFIVLLQVIGIDLTALSVFGGALGVGLGFGLQKIASNFISGIILLFEKSMEVDDVVELQDGTMGIIRHTGARYTLIETPEGREILVPNEDFITQRMVNWTYSTKKARVEIKVCIAYDSDVDLARKLMLESVKAHPRTIQDPAAECLLSQFGDNGIEMLLYFWIKDIGDGRQEPKSEVMLAVWRAFKAHKIVIPYPQREVRVVYETADDTSKAGAL